MKKLFIQVLGLTFLCLALLAGYNYYRDEAGLFHRDYSAPRADLNEHFVKMRYLLENPDKYDAFCFGSSRIGNIDLRRIDDGHYYYNMTYATGLPREWADDIKMLLAHGVPIKKILLGCDDFSFRIDPVKHESQYMKIPYRESNWKTYMAFLFKSPTKPEKAAEKGNFFDIYDTGRPFHEQVDDRIDSNPEQHLEEMKTKKPTHFEWNYMPQAVQALKEIKETCEQNNIELVVFINPIHHTTYMDTNREEFNEFKRELAAITPYYDFSGLNEVTMNDMNYYETSHYRPLVGDMMIDRIFREPQDMDTDFGFYVTKKNVEVHIGRLTQQEAYAP